MMEELVIDKKMKVLYLVDNQADFGAYFLYNGLCELLGEENITIYPSKLSYLGLTDKYYTLDDGKRGNTSPGEYIKPRNLPIITAEEIFDTINTFDIIVLSSPRTYAVKALQLNDSELLPLMLALVLTAACTAVNSVLKSEPEITFSGSESDKASLPDQPTAIV